MFLGSEDIMDISKPLLKEHFPNHDNVTVRFDHSLNGYIVRVGMRESDYIADLLASELDLDDIAEEIKKEVIKLFGYCEPVKVVQVKSITEYYSQLAFAC